jgi:hypothetical protein
MDTATRGVEDDLTLDRPRARARDPVLVIGLGLIALMGVVLRSVNLVSRPLGTDEPTIVGRALIVAQGELVPAGFDYPPLSSYLVGAVLRVVAVVRPSVLTHELEPYLVSRGVFILLSGILIVMVGLLGAVAAGGERRHSTVVGLGSASTMAVSYLVVRLGSMSKPDVLQMVFAVGCVLAAVHWIRRENRDWWLLLLSGVLAGLAAASKYAGVLAAVPVGVAVLLLARSWLDRGRNLALLGLGSLTGFLGGTLGMVITQFPEFLDGFLTEFTHQTEGHLGYEPSSSGWWFHATTSLPGTWGLGLTVAALVGTAWAVVRGDSALRVVTGAGVVLFAVTGASSVQFPHYILLALPFLAVVAWAAVAHVGVRAGRGGLAVAALLLLLSLVPSTMDAVRLVRAWGAPDTRTLAAAVQEAFEEPLRVEQYTGRPYDAQGGTFAFGFTPEIIDCGCVLALSSYQEERFRRRPDLYPDEVAVYDEIRAAGDVLAVVEPDVPLSYRWDQLPQWGAGRLPLFGPIRAVGPTITIVDLR